MVQTLQNQLWCEVYSVHIKIILKCNLQSLKSYFWSNEGLYHNILKRIWQLFPLQTLFWSNSLTDAKFDIKFHLKKSWPSSAIFQLWILVNFINMSTAFYFIYWEIIYSLFSLNIKNMAIKSALISYLAYLLRVWIQIRQD